MTKEADGNEYTAIEMKFYNCRESQDLLASQYGVSPVVSTDVETVRIVQLATPSGNLRVTCSAPDSRMIAVRGPAISMFG